MDEWTLSHVLGNQTAHDRVLKPHWDTWIRFSDFQKIAASGFNMVRIPIGHWAYDDLGPYARGAAPYLDKAIGWARKTGLKVMIDLHGAPRSQNGFDNSGRRLPKPLWTTGDTVKETLEVLHKIQAKYGHASYDDVIAGIELLNEPQVSELDPETVKQFHRNGYGQQRAISPSRVVVIQDGFKEPKSYNGWLTPSDQDSQWVAIDHHEYQVFDDGLVAMGPWQHRQYVCNHAQSYSGADKWTLVGEWSAAMTDYAPYLNGYGRGSRYAGTFPGSHHVGSCKPINDMRRWSQAFKDDTRGYIEAQMETFEAHTQGWVFWTWRTESSPEWDAFRLIDAGIFPQPLWERKFGAICDNN